MFNEIAKKIILFALLFLILFTFSITGYMYIEGWDFDDAIYMTVITISTIGYGEVHPLTNYGRIHTMIIVFTGVSLFSTMLVYFSGLISSLFLEGKLRNILYQKSILNRVKKMEKHYIVCGYGRIGREICDSLKLRKDFDFIIIENNDKKVDEARNSGFIVLNGDATEDEILLEAGIHHAKGIICALTDDALNVFITLSAKVLNQNINIIARADKSESVEKLKRAGAHRVITPYKIGGKRMASAATQPNVSDFLDTVLHDPQFDLQIEEFKISSKSKISNQLIKDARSKESFGALIIAIIRDNNKIINNPRGDDLILVGDTLIVLGSFEQLEYLKTLV